MRRMFEFNAPGERVWEFIVDPVRRVGAINVVNRFDVSDDGRHATWHLELPIPFVCLMVTVETEDIKIDELTHVKFVGKLRVMQMTGEYTIEEHDGDSCLVNEFTVDGQLPGVEAFLGRNLDRELDNLETEFRREFETTA